MWHLNAWKLHSNIGLLTEQLQMQKQDYFLMFSPKWFKKNLLCMNHLDAESPDRRFPGSFCLFWTLWLQSSCRMMHWLFIVILFFYIFPWFVLPVIFNYEIFSHMPHSIASAHSRGSTLKYHAQAKTVKMSTHMNINVEPEDETSSLRCHFPGAKL